MHFIIIAIIDYEIISTQKHGDTFWMEAFFWPSNIFQALHPTSACNSKSFSFLEKLFSMRFFLYPNQLVIFLSKFRKFPFLCMTLLQ